MRWTLLLASFLASLLILLVEAAIDQTRPVLLLPGFASSQLQSWSRTTCIHSFQKNLYKDVKVGDRLWIDVGRILAQGDCWIRCMQLHTANQTEIDCKLRAAVGLGAISELDPGIVTGFLSTVWGVIIKDLVENFDMDPLRLIVAPYDWRLPPSQLQARDLFFSSLKRQLETTVEVHGNNGVVVIAHSMGNDTLRYFLAWLKREMGKEDSYKWIQKHISAYFAVGSPLLGSSEGLELITSGITSGLPLLQREIQKMQISFGSVINFMPLPSGERSSLDDDVLMRVKFNANGPNEHIVNYTSSDIASGKWFRDMGARDPAFAAFEEMRQKFYVADGVVDHTEPWERPPIASVYSVYGVNLPTKYSYEYQDTSSEGLWEMLLLKYEDPREQVCNRTGDGTVPYHSLSWAHTWLGEPGVVVNVTQVPQVVYFSPEHTTQFQMVREAQNHHAQYEAYDNDKFSAACSTESGSGASGGGGFFDAFFGSSSLDQITFFERTHQADGMTYSTGVWEIDSCGHRDILSNPAFLRELRAELRHIFDGKTNSDKSARPPVIDSDCYWNYRQAKCEFPGFCEYRYNFGDVTLDQSCRIRQQKSISGALPLPPDHIEPSTSLTSASAVVADSFTLLEVSQKPTLWETLMFTNPYCAATQSEIDETATDDYQKCQNNNVT